MSSLAGRQAPAALVALALMAGAAAAGADGPEAPLGVRNSSPLPLLFGLPRPRGAVLDPGSARVSLGVEHANNFTSDWNGPSGAYLDGATTVTSLTLRRAWRARFEWGVELPAVHHGGGFTDAVVDGFHDLFGLPDGDRDQAPRGRLEYVLVENGRTLARVGDSGTHLGDVRGWIGYRLGGGSERRAALRAMLKLPTGQAEDLAGSGAADLALWWELYDRRSLSELGLAVSFMGGVTFPGDSDLALADQRRAVVSGHVGLHFPLRPALTLHAQLDGHSDLTDAAVPQLGEAALLGTLGATWLWTADRWLDVSLVEDLTTRRASDVVFGLTLGSRF